MLSKSKASPCILTLILSFVLSDYLINLMNCKLKACIRNSGFSAKSNVSAFNKSQYQTESEVLFNPLLLIHAKRSEEIPSGFPRYGSGLHTSSTALRDCPRTWVSRKRETCVKPRAVSNNFKTKHKGKKFRSEER